MAKWRIGEMANRRNGEKANRRDGEMANRRDGEMAKAVVSKNASLPKGALAKIQLSGRMNFRKCE
jgi:hypothetical protein